MINKIVKSIHKLRLVLFGVIIFMFLMILGLNPINISSFIGASFGKAVGLSVGVAENPYNKVAAQLKEKEAALDQRENELEEREQALSTPVGPQKNLLYIVFFGIIILFILLVFNFYFDYKRNKMIKNGGK